MEIGPKLRELRIAKNLTQFRPVRQFFLGKILGNAWGLPSMNSSAKTRKSRSSSTMKIILKRKIRNF